jgi:hypothetical protein
VLGSRVPRSSRNQAFDVAAVKGQPPAVVVNVPEVLVDLREVIRGPRVLVEGWVG